MANINNWDDNIFLTGDEYSDQIDNSGEYVTISSNSGNDNIRNWGTNVTIDAGTDDDVIQDWGGSNVSINGGAGNDSIYINHNTGNATINTGDGDDTVSLWGSSLGSDRIVQVGSGNNFLNLTNVSSINVIGSNGSEQVKITAPVYSNQASLETATFTGGAGNDTIYGTIGEDVFNYSSGDGYDVIYNYGGEDIINITSGNVSDYYLNGADVVLNIGSQSITVKDAKDHAIKIKDSNGKVTNQVYGNTQYTQHDVLKRFMNSLDKTTLTNTESALDEAVKSCSTFSGIQDAINNFISDCRSAADADTFLKHYCGIDLDNADTGAITGWDAGGLNVKDSDSVVPETGSSSYPSGSTITKRGLTLNLPSNLTDQQQLVVQGLNSWWLEEAIKLVEESYGLSFYNNNVNFTSMDLNFYSRSGAFESAYVNTSSSYSYDNYNNKYNQQYSVSLNINMAKVSFNSSDLNGDGLDRILAHEMTHALQHANIDVDLPNFIVEGMADLVPGIDDWRGDVMKTLASNPSTLAYYVNLNNNVSGTENVYAAGYMFLRYLAKQAASPYMEPSETVAPDTTPADTTPADTTPADTTPADTTPSDTTPADTTPAGLTYNSDKTKLIVNNDFTGWLSSSSYEPNVEIIDASSRTVGINITGNSYNNSIVGSKSSDSINGGYGNDTLTGGKGNDLFVYKNGDGNDVITDYTAGDKISISGSKISKTSVNGSDVILKIGNGSLKIKNGKSMNLSIYNNSSTLTNTVISGVSNSTTSADTTATIKGTSGNDLLKGNSKANTIIGGKGNDTLTGGSGADVFIYASGDGNDIITDYTVGQDKIKITGAKISKTSVSGNDVILKVGSGSIKVKNGKGKRLSLYNNATSLTNTIIGSSSSSGTSTTKTTTLTVTNSTKSPVVATSTIKNINASTRTTAVKIMGNSLANSIVGGSGADSINGGVSADTLNGGRGNDTLTGGAGRDVFIYRSGQGNDVITDYTAQDKISITGGTYTKSTVGNDVRIKVGTGSLLLKNAKGKSITINNSRAFEERWFMEGDNNFTTSEVSTIINDNKNISGNYSLENELKFAQDIEITPLTSNRLEHSEKK